MSSQRFPGFGQPAVDDRIVAPGSGAEILDGKLILSPPALEGHAVPHADLAYLLRAHVNPGFTVAVDMLTRTSLDCDFAPDVSVYESARNPMTGGRQLEQIAFEVVSEQALAEQTSKARELTKRGVRRVFCLVVKQSKMLEWSHSTDAWSVTPVELIEDACLAIALPTRAVLQATHADTAVLQALRAKGHPEFEAVRAAGHEQGREEGREEGLRISVLDLCEMYSIAPTHAQRSQLDRMPTAELDALRVELKRRRAWPSR